MVEDFADALLLEVALDLLPALPPGGVLAAGGGLGQVLGQPDRREHLLLLGAQLLGVEGDRLLHRGQREQLQEVVLDHVAGGADAVVVAGATGDADVLGHGDLHVVDVVGVPDRLEHLVGEAQGQEVLHRLLAQVVVDPEDRVGREDPLDDVVELAGALEVVAERLLDDDPAPRAGGRLGQAAAVELLADGGEEAGRDGQVERVVAAGAALLLQARGPSRRAGRTPRGRRTCPARSGSPRPAGARPPRGTGCGRGP